MPRKAEAKPERKSKERAIKPISVYLPPDDAAWLREQSAVRDLTLTQLVRRLVREARSGQPQSTAA